MELPDVNVLIALFDAAHVHYEPSQAWFAVAREQGWATCPLTENGFVRIVSNPNYPNVRFSIAEAAAHLRALRTNHARTHGFWPDDVSLCDATLFNLAAVQGHRQLTDLYLLGLCQRHGATLVTFDTAIQTATLAIVDPRSNLVRLLPG